MSTSVNLFFVLFCFVLFCFSTLQLFPFICISTGSNVRKIANPTIGKIYNLFWYRKTVWTCLYIKQLYSKYVYIAVRENWHVFTEAQFILNFQVYNILRIQINVIEKKENSVQNRHQNVVFSCAYATMKQNVRLFSAFKGAYPGLLPETNSKILHANCISNTPSAFFFFRYVFKGS